MKSNKLPLIIILIAVALGSIMFFSTKDKSSTASEPAEVIKVGMSGSYKPYTYLDEKGELTKMLNVRVYPTSAVLNKSGKVEKVLPGHLEKAEIKNVIMKQK